MLRPRLIIAVLLTAVLRTTAQTVYGPNVIPTVTTTVNDRSGTIGIFTYTISGGGPAIRLSQFSEADHTSGQVGENGATGIMTGVISTIETGRKYQVTLDSSNDGGYSEPATVYTLGGVQVRRMDIITGGPDDASKTLVINMGGINAFGYGIRIRQLFTQAAGSLVPQKRKIARQLLDQQKEAALFPNCPRPLTECPLSASPTETAFECIDVETELGSCGGCVYRDAHALDCEAIPGVALGAVSCVKGVCQISACDTASGWYLEGSTCVRDTGRFDWT